MERVMFKHAEDLEFEQAALVRDQMALLKAEQWGIASGPGR